MNSRSLQAVLRSLARSNSAQSDAELLRKFVSERDERAFTALVHRHGRLVWAVCRHLTRSDADADDAFQATFLVLIRNAGKVRDPGKFSAWLHGVAYKVCAKARESAKRRVLHEQASASRHRNGCIVPDSAWDRALAAVHEEVARLPEKLRAPFVLCCLEGKSVTDAADQLGCKLSALSARLVRAKNALQTRLEARGVTVGVAAATVAVTAGSAGNVPAAVIAKAARWLQSGGTIPDSILNLSQGVMTMSISKTKFVAAGLIMACGLGLGGVRWAVKADAQEGRPNPIRTLLQSEKPDLPKPVQNPRFEPDSDLFDNDKRPATPVGPIPRWEYDFVPASEMVPGKFVNLLQDREAQGWEFNGEVTLRYKGVGPHWVFRRPNTKPHTAADLAGQLSKEGATTYFAPSERLARVAGHKEIEVEIKRLQEKLKQLDDAESQTTQTIRLNKNAATLAAQVHELARQRFGAKNSLHITFDNSSESIFLGGPPDVVKWAAAVINLLSGDSDQAVRP